MITCCWIFVLLFAYTKGGEPLNCNNRDIAKTATMRLKLDLLCNYDKYVRPVLHHSNKTTVRLIFAPRIITFDEAQSTLIMKAWISMSWKDEHLTWDKLKYDEIEHISLDTSMVWVPDLSVYNSKDEVSLDQLVSPILVDNQGGVYSFISPLITGHCVPNWVDWPFDTHTCNIVLGSKRYLGSTVDFKFIDDRKGLNLNYVLPSKDWELLNTNSTRNVSRLGPKNETTLYLVSIIYTFTFRRHASVYVASYLLPGVVMMIMSLGLLFLPSNGMERVAVLCTLVVIESLFLQYLAYKIPANGDKMPYIVSFYRDCLAITGLLVIETLVTRSMTSWNSNPSYLQKTFQFITSNKVLQFIFVNDMDPKNTAKLIEGENDEGSILVKASDSPQQWQIFVGIVNKAFFILLLLVYFLLFVSLIPFN